MSTQYTFEVDLLLRITLSNTFHKKTHYKNVCAMLKQDAFYQQV